MGKRVKPSIPCTGLMTEDDAYLSKFGKTVSFLLEQAGSYDNIPQEYANYLSHRYSDGTVSLLDALPSLTNTDLLDATEVDSAVSILSKVVPNHWPDSTDIVTIDAEQLLDSTLSSCEKELNFVEDNLGTAKEVDTVLTRVIESVFKSKIANIRDKSGNYPSPSNNFLQDKDGTFVGTFTHENFKFYFEIIPTEGEWICTYRLTESSLDRIPKKTRNEKRDNKFKQARRRIRTRGW